MNQKDMERLEKESIYTITMSNLLKDQVINSHLNELNRVIKTNIRKKDLKIIVTESNLIK